MNAASGRETRRATLMLLDSASLYFRAFYGVKASMPAPDGTPTNAVRGFLDMVSVLITRFRPTDMVACIDQDWRPAWRVALIPSYKTHRLAEPDAEPQGGAPAGEAEPPGLAEQVPIIFDALAALGIASLGAPDHEADDVIATLAERATMPVDVVTGDRDLFQLIDDARGVRVLYTGRGVAKVQIMDDAALLARYGDALVDAARARDPRLIQVAAKLNAARDYLTRAPEVVRTARGLALPTVDTALPRAPRDEEKLDDLGTRWGIGSALGRATEALRLPATT